jgi:probable rRNA maturation factor
MMYEIEIQNEDAYPVDEERLRAAALAVLDRHEVEDGTTLTIVLTSSEDVAALNRDFRGVDSPTDVLSFPADIPPLPDEPPYLGDLIIAYPYASAQAARQQHALMDSLALLVVHGTLHLLGYDHDTLENKAEMWDAQSTALTALGIAPEIVPPLENDDHDED